jgi:hypothetical protein
LIIIVVVVRRRVAGFGGIGNTNWMGLLFRTGAVGAHTLAALWPHAVCTGAVDLIG